MRSQSHFTSAAPVLQIILRQTATCLAAMHLFAAKAQPAFSDANWSPLGSGIAGSNCAVFALAVSGTNLYAGGHFTMAGGHPASNIARWDGNNWSPLGTGVGGSGFSIVYALAVSGETLYVGGRFTAAGSGAATNIAQWDGTSWSPVGSGLSAGVDALTVSGGTLYAAGGFIVLDGDGVNHMAQWDGSAWSGLAGGMPNESVYGLAVFGGALFAGGRFNVAGGSAVNNVALWDGENWWPVGSGLTGGPGVIWALAPGNDKLYAGGAFTLADGNQANSVAQWDGNGWSTLGSGLGPVVNIYGVQALAVAGGNLFAGGYFTNSDDSADPCHYIAQWNGSRWRPLGSGMNTNVNALAVSGNALYAGGAFTMAGGKAAAYIAKATLPSLSIATTGALFGFNNGRFQFSVEGPAGSNAVVEASPDLQTWIPVATNLLSSGSFVFTDVLATNPPRCFYRAKLGP